MHTKSRTYSLFAREDGKWVRMTPLALKLKDASRMFQNVLLSATMHGVTVELRPAAEDFDRDEEYRQNKTRIFTWLVPVKPVEEGERA